ncbi:MAG: response regulator [Anaerolineae bacterium]
MRTADQFRHELRDALKHLYDPRLLRKSPLVALLGLETRANASLALQTVLIDAIEALKPPADAAPGSRNARRYYLLLYSYVQQFTQEQVAEQLGISARHLRREQRVALQCLARRLMRDRGLEQQVLRDATPAAEEPEVNVAPALEQELDWLGSAPPSESVDLAQALDQVLEVARTLASRHGVVLAPVSVKPTPPLVVHPVALRQCLLGLLTVAIHRARPSGCVQVRANASGTEVEVTLQVEGGEEAADIEDEDCLQMVRRMAQMSGCRACVSGDGQSFAAALAIPTLEHMTVLALDDNADTIQLLERYVMGTRYRLAATRDPSDLEAVAARVSPRIIVLDVMMPQLDGWAVLGRLQGQASTRNVPVVVCTVLPQEDLALSLGAAAFVRKPLTRQSFLAALERAVAARATR